MQIARTETALARLGPTSLAEAREFAKDIVESGLYPKLRTPGAAVMFIVTAQDLGIPISAALRDLDVLETRVKDPESPSGWRTQPTVALRAELQVALVQNHPECAFLRLKHDPTKPGNDDKFATWETAYRSNPQEVFEASFSIEEAQRLGYLDKSQWQKQPGVMLIWRAATRLIKRYWSKVMLGLASSEEVRDDIEVRRAEIDADGNTIDQTPSTNLAKAKALLKAQTQPKAEVVEEAHDEPAPSEPSAAAFKVLEQLKETWATITKRYGGEVAKRVWHSSRGPGDVKGLTDVRELELRRDKADDVLEALELGASINEVREQWRPLMPKGQAPTPIETPERWAIEELREMLKADQKRLADLKRKASKAPEKAEDEGAREPGSEG